MPWTTVTVCVQHDVRGLCCKPYPGHARGCPNFGTKAGCPPQAPLIEAVLDLSRPVTAVYNVFDLAGHREWMRGLHPDWSPRQLDCCLYWQMGARKRLRDEIVKWTMESPFERLAMIAVETPEACGVNLTETMRSAGIVLEWPPDRVAYQIVLAGWPARQPVNQSTQEPS